MAEEILPAESFFNRNFGIGSGDLEKVLATALGRKADYADLYFEYRRNEGISLEEGLVKNCSQSTANGVGVRVLAETKTGYAYTDDITIENLELAARTAQYIAQNQQSQLPVSVGQSPSEAHDLYPIKVPLRVRRTALKRWELTAADRCTLTNPASPNCDEKAAIDVRRR